MNIAKMMSAAATAQKKMAKIQEELAEEKVTGSSGGGKVVVEASGSGEFLSLKIDPEVIDPDDIEMLEDLTLAAFRQAATAAKELSEKEMGKLTAGLGLPKLPF